jgi:hypothetical protein
MQYTINEGKLQLTQTWQDQTVNVLIPQDTKVKGANLVIARDVLPMGLSLETYLGQQKTNFAKQLDSFEVLREFQETSQPSDQEQKIQYLEFTWKKDKQVIYQLMAIRQLNASSLLCFTSTVPGGFDQEVCDRLLNAVRSFKPNQSAA